MRAAVIAVLALALAGQLSAGLVFTPAEKPLRPTTLAPWRARASGDVDLLARIAQSATCRAAYTHQSRPAPIARTGSLTLDPGDAEAMRLQMAVGPFKQAGDYRSGSPGEAARLALSAQRFIAAGEPTAARPTHGSGARDAAYLDALQHRPQVAALVGAYLVQQAADPANNFARLLCLRERDGSVRDAWFGEAAWLARYVLTYDYVRDRLPDADRVTVEAFIRASAYFFAAQIDYGLAYVFPRRLQDDYSVRASAAASGELLSQRVDTDRDCRITASDDPRLFPTHAYDGGPRIAVLSLWWNNRKSTSAFAVGLAGALLGDPILAGRAKRYFREWLAYSVHPDGSEGEYGRSGDYCIAQQGLIYAAFNVQGAALLADVLARHGDTDLLRYSASGRTIGFVIQTRLDLLLGRLLWRHDGVPLGLMAAQYNGVGRPIDSAHELGLLLAAKRFAMLPIRQTVLREDDALRWPGATGHAVATGYGSPLGAWTDVFNAYPSALLLRAP